MGLVECIVLSVPTASAAALSRAVASTVTEHEIVVHDARLITRAEVEPRAVLGPPDHTFLDATVRRPEMEPEAALSRHDLELAAAALEPGSVALVLLVEDTWSAVTRTVHELGGLVASSQKAVTGQPTTSETAAAGSRHDLVDRLRPVRTDDRRRPTTDIAASLRELAVLVDGDVVSLDQYEACRRELLSE